MTVEAIQQEFLKLPLEEQRMLGDFIIRFLIYPQQEASTESELTEAQKEELERRIELANAGKMPFYTLEEVKQKSQETLTNYRNGKL